MNTEKIEIKRKARGLGFFLMGHQLFFLLGTTVLTAIVGSALSIIEMEYLESATLCIISDLIQLVAGVFFLVFFLVNRKKINETPMEKSKCTPKLFAKCILSIFAVNMALSLIDMLLVNFTGFSLTMPSDSMTDMNPLLMFITVAVFPAIVEELLYRGVLYKYLRGHGVQFAAITSSIIFGLIHLNFLQFFFASFMGVVCCYIYEATGKIRYSMILHLLNNSLLVLFSILPISDFTSVIIQVALGVISIIGAVIYLVCRKKKFGGLKTNLTKDTKKSILYFFTSVPMMIFVLICLGVCVFMSFG